MVYNQIRRVANLNAPVLIRGESGTGKELIAQAEEIVKMVDEIRQWKA